MIILPYIFYSNRFSGGQFLCQTTQNSLILLVFFCLVGRKTSAYQWFGKIFHFRSTLLYMPSDDKLSLTSIINNKWIKLNNVANILKPLYGATKYLSQSNYPTLGSTLFIYVVLLKVSFFSEIYNINIQI